MKNLKKEIEKIIIKALEYNEEEDAQDGLIDENGDSVPDYDWTEKAKKDFIDKLTSLFLSTLSGLKAMEEEKQQSYNPDVNISQAGRNQLRQEILKELKAELRKEEGNNG